MRARVDLWMVIGIVAITAFLACVGPRLLSHRPVRLYPGELPPPRISEISRKLDDLNISHILGNGCIEVAPEERAHIIGALLSCGLPLPPAPSMTCHLEPDRTEKFCHDLEGRLVDELRLMEGVTDAHVTFQPYGDPLLSTPPKPWAVVQLTLKSGHRPTRAQIRAVQAHVTWAARAWIARDVEVVDAQGRVLSSEQP